MQQIKKWIIPFVIIGLLGLVLFNLANKAQAPTINFTTLDGKQFSLASLKGKVVLVNFWATDCPSCIKEMSDFVRAYQDFKDQGFEIVAVAMPYDPPAQVANYTKQKQLPFPVMHDGNGTVTRAFGEIRITPTSIVFNREGKRIHQVIGELSYDKIKAILEKET